MTVSHHNGKSAGMVAPASPPAEKGEGSVGDYVREYEFRGDGGDYTPNEGERLLIEDALHGWIARAHGDDVRGVSFDGDDLSEAFRAGALSAQPVSPSEGEAVSDLERRAFDGANTPQSVEFYQRLVRDLWKAACDGSEMVAATHPASDQSDTERMKAALKHYACSCAPGQCAMSDDGGPDPVDDQLCGRVAQAALAEKAADQ